MTKMKNQVAILDVLLIDGEDRVRKMVSNEVDSLFEVTVEDVDWDNFDWSRLPKERMEESFFIPYYSIVFNKPLDDSAKQNILKKIEDASMCREFHEVWEVRETEDCLIFQCYGGEGPCVIDIRNILWVINDLFGPTIKENLKQCDLSPDKVVFHVNIMW
jgi:hypothetical protein